MWCDNIFLLFSSATQTPKPEIPKIGKPQTPKPLGPWGFVLGLWLHQLAQEGSFGIDCAAPDFAYGAASAVEGRERCKEAGSV